MVPKDIKIGRRVEPTIPRSVPVNDRGKGGMRQRS